MKLPTSSSILFATLAISSSSSCLAAPAGTHSQDTDMSNHGNIDHGSNMHMPSGGPSQFDSGNEGEFGDGRSHNMRSVGSQHLGAREDVADLSINLVSSLPVVGSPLAKIVTPLLAVNQASAQSVDDNGSTSTPDVNPQDMAALQSAIQKVSRALNSNYSSLSAPAQDAVGGVVANLPAPTAVSSVKGDLPLSSAVSGLQGSPLLPGPASGLVSGLPFAAKSDGGDPNASAVWASSYASSAAPGPTQASEAATEPSASSTTASSSAFANPSASPPMPGNPPNTPSLPQPVPALPIKP